MRRRASTALARETTALARETDDDMHPRTIVASRKLAAMQVGDHETAPLLALVEPLVAHPRAGLGHEHPDTPEPEQYLALGQVWSDRIDEALQVYRRLLEAYEGLPGPQHAPALMVLSNLGTLLDTRRAESEQGGGTAR